MKAKDIVVGGVYLARVSGKLTSVRVDAIEEVYSSRCRWRDWYRVTNLATGRKLTFYSPQKFRGAVRDEASTHARITDEQRRENLQDVLHAAAAVQRDALAKRSAVPGGPALEEVAVENEKLNRWAQKFMPS